MGTIKVSQLGKAYKQYPSRWARMKEWLLPGRSRHVLKWVLQDVSFTVQPGEALGIIGLNGAGKSTLLKMITGTTQPTTGSVEISGRVAALLELGMGFHPDFTGRQNVQMAGQLLGLSVDMISELMPHIEEFAEIGNYIDEPVRVYSSGMQMRLAFSLATARRPDILIVDEALSVGDAYFQHKSFERIRTFREQGTTLLIVSHDKQAIQSVCDRAILLNHGRAAMEGPPEAVMDYYNALLAEHQGQVVKQEVLESGKVQTISGTGEATILDVWIADSGGQRIEIVNVGERVALVVAARCHSALPELIVGYMIKDRLGQPVFGTNTHHLNRNLRQLDAGADVRFEFYFDANIGPGTYSVAVALHTAATHHAKNYEWRDLAVVFKVINSSKSEFVGLAWIPPEVRCSQ
jgi:lipopolysaccharide transport system ATP-binding protein